MVEEVVEEEAVVETADDELPEEFPQLGHKEGHCQEEEEEEALDEQEVVEQEEGDAQAGEVEEEQKVEEEDQAEKEEEEVAQDDDVEERADEAEGGAGGRSDDWNAWSSRDPVLMLSFESCCWIQGLMMMML